MKVIAVLTLLVAAAVAQERPAQYAGLREFLQHLMSLEQKQQGAAQGDEILVSNDGVPLLEIPDEGVYEIYQDPTEVSYYPEANNGVGYNYNKYESAGKLSYLPEVSRPKRQAQQQAAAPATPTNAQNENRFTTFLNNFGALTTNLRRQTADALRGALRQPGNRIFQNNAAPAPAQPQVTSLNDVYGATIGARSRTRRHAPGAVQQTFAAIIDFETPVAMRSAVERSDIVPQVAIFETATNDRLQLLEEPPFEPIVSHAITKRSAQEEPRRLLQDPFADLFRPLQEIFGIVNATTRAVFKDVLIPPPSVSGGFQAVSKHEFKLNDREGTVVETTAHPTPEGPVTAKVQMKQTFYNPHQDKIETATHEGTVMIPLLSPFFSLNPQQFEPSRLTETLERIAVPFQRAFTNFTSELGKSIFTAMNDAPSAKKPEEKVSAANVDSASTNSAGDVSLEFFRPAKKNKKEKTAQISDSSIFQIDESNIYRPEKTENNVVPNAAKLASA